MFDIIVIGNVENENRIKVSKDGDRSKKSLSTKFKNCLKNHLIISASCHALMNFCMCAKYAHNANLLILWERYFFNFIVIRKTFQVKSFTVQRKKNSLFILPHATDEINLLMDYHVTRIKFHSVALSVSTSLFALFWTVDGQFHCYRCIKHIVQFYINETGKLIK